MSGAAPGACVVNLGCRVNRVESDTIVRRLADEGLRVCDEAEADVVVVNTCAVTGEAEAKTRKAVRRALGQPRAPWVVVCGCAAALHPDALSQLSPRVVVELQKSKVPERARALAVAAGGIRPSGTAQGMGPAPAGGDGPAGAAGADSLRLLGRARLGVKIQDGCNNRCSYCIVWRARGPERSEPVEQVVDQVRDACAQGVPEIVLTGVNLAAYRGRDGRGAPVLLEDLLEVLLERTAVPQIRLSSLEPMDVRPALLELMAASGGRIAPYLHLPLQAGCTATLRRMRRPYSAQDYERIVERCRAAVPGIAISCDVIAGFPGETEAEFEQTRTLCERAAFSKMHVFRYSARPGTPAAAAPDQVPAPVMAERAAELRELGARLARADAAARVGTVERAVLEDGPRGTLGSFHRVMVDDLAGSGDTAAPGFRLVELAIIGQDGDGLLHGRLVEGGAGAPRSAR